MSQTTKPAGSQGQSVYRERVFAMNGSVVYSMLVDFFDFFTTDLSGSNPLGVAIDISIPDNAAP